MKKVQLASFEEFLLLNPAYRPYEFGNVGFFSTMEMPEKQLIKKQMKNLFDYREDYTELTAWNDLTKPVVLWDRTTIIQDSGVLGRLDGQAVWYNYPDGIIISKPDTIKALQKINCPHIPKTVYDREKAKAELEFPIIAKASNTFQSRGVEKVDTKADLDKLPGGFDMYQEQIKIKEEFRLLFFRSHELHRKDSDGFILLAAFRRDPLNKKAKGLRVDEGGMYHDRLMDNAKSDFAWTQINPNNYEMDLNEVYALAKYVFDINPTLNITGIDLAIDKAGKYWFIEQNTTPGMFSNQAVLIFKAVYEDVNGPVSPKTYKTLVDLSKAYAKLTDKEEAGFSVADIEALENLNGYLPQ